MSGPERPAMRFLRAEWRDLAMLNYEVDPQVLVRHVPAGTELDTWNGRTFVSVVGFRFLETRVLGVPVPFHVNFEEVNLRFYVRRKAEDGWRRGVVFVKEIVPRRAIALVARLAYAENYVCHEMRHSVEPASVSYGWKRGGAWEGLTASISGSPTLPGDDEEETFITEHYWGYSRLSDGESVEYRVEHPRWRVWRAQHASLACDAASLYGAEFAEVLSRAPSTAFVADGSPVLVRLGRRL
jgi:uncharacterized protein